MLPATVLDTGMSGARMKAVASKQVEMEVANGAIVIANLQQCRVQCGGWSWSQSQWCPCHEPPCTAWCLHA